MFGMILSLIGVLPHRGILEQGVGPDDAPRARMDVGHNADGLSLEHSRLIEFMKLGERRIVYVVGEDFCVVKFNHCLLSPASFSY